MYVNGHKYGDKWYQTLCKILSRLADVGEPKLPGLIILEGAKDSGKTDMIRFIGELIDSFDTYKQLSDDKGRKLAQLVYSKRYLRLDLGEDTSGQTVPVTIISRIMDLIYNNGIDRGRNLFIAWDNVDKCWPKHSQDNQVHPNLYEQVNLGFFENIHRPLPLWDHMTFLVSATVDTREHFNKLPFSANSDHYLQL